MDFEGVKTWLTGQAEKRAKTCRLKAVLGFVLAPVAVAFGTRCVYGLARLFLQNPNYSVADPNTCLWISLAAIPLMFIGNWVTPRRDLMEERMSGDDVDLAMARYGGGRGVVMLYLFLWILFTGPRLVDWARASLRERRKWQQLDTHSCAAVLWLLASRLKKVPYEDIQREIPWLNLDETMLELSSVPGVLRLKAPPPGLALTDDLRKAVCLKETLEF